MSYYIAWLILQPWKLFLHVEGKENIPKEKSKLLVIASHNSYFDPWIISIYLRYQLVIHWFAKVQFFTKEELAQEFADDENAVIRWLFPRISGLLSLIVRNSKTIPVDKDNESAAVNLTALRRSMQLFKCEELVGIFPRAKVRERKYVNAIFLKLAVKCQVPILPVNIKGKRLVFGKVFYVESCGEDTCREADEIMKKIEAM